ncbi:MAG: benzoyl-CoA-dihydrodiol lyase [Betaproteobacteria bacterium RIFCSPLOWO2_02_FULL_63_19]|nr:MAG: benzoyl-CoA-dihydrodiol lyase [Betaproteobacteria bacterium RIFCSPLOWO2_02_FULL_63_19]
MSAVQQTDAAQARSLISFDTHPDRYNHWKLDVQGSVATLAMNVNEDKGLKPGYKLKLNSYDLGVDIELHDALQRIRFEHPAVKTVVLTSARERMFCSGANIYMLGLSTHAWKVNFCKFTNETRNGIEDSSRHSGLKFLAAVNGTVAGGGYELALACDEILMIDDRSSTVSLPELPLLGVLPGTGGLTRVTDKRKVRRDLADVFCTTSEGVRADRAKQWKLVDHAAKPQRFAQAVSERVAALAAQSNRSGGGKGVTLTPLDRTIDDAGYHYEHVDAEVDRKTRVASITVRAPGSAQPTDVDGILAAGAAWWPLAMARELDDAILMLRTNELEVGTWLLKTRGDIDAVLAVDQSLKANQSNWFVNEVIGMLRRTLARLDVTSRTLYAIIDKGSCFAGTLLEIALSADRSYMLALPDEPDESPCIALSDRNFGSYPMVNHQTRMLTRFCDDEQPAEATRARIGEKLRAEQAAELGLVTFTPDDLDWDDEVRLAIEERTSQSPDALTGLEANLRFTGTETMETRIFARLSAWQNWIFNRPNAVGEQGALKVYGTGGKAKFNWERI